MGGKSWGGLDYVDSNVEFPVGFDYSVMSGPERIFMYQVVRWIAQVLLPDKPEYYYDTEEKFPVEGDVAERFRIALDADPLVDYMKMDKVKLANDMYQKLLELDVAWKARKKEP